MDPYQAGCSPHLEGNQPERREREEIERERR
jgi:hypothetical protein